MPERKWTLVVTSHGRWEYLARTLAALNPIGDSFTRRIYSCDGCDPYEFFGGVEGSTYLSTGPERMGLTANLAQAWGALTAEDEWVFHLEEDFVVHDAPLDEMAGTLDAFPRVANMVLLRQPVNPAELRYSSVLPTIPGGVTERGGWLEHTAGFWLNPMVAHSSLLRSLQPGVEESLTRQCRARGLSFAYYGGLHDPPRCEHIGAEGGMGSDGWRA